MGKRVDLTGKRFGRWTVVSESNLKEKMYDKSNPRTEIFIEEMEDEADANLRTLP